MTGGVTGGVAGRAAAPVVAALCGVIRTRAGSLPKPKMPRLPRLRISMST